MSQPDFGFAPLLDEAFAAKDEVIRQLEKALADTIEALAEARRALASIAQEGTPGPPGPKAE